MRHAMEWLAAAAFAAILALAPMDGHAASYQTPRDEAHELLKAKPTFVLIATWERLNTDCRGSYEDPEHNPSCGGRDWISEELQSRGYELVFPLEHWEYTKTVHK